MLPGNITCINEKPKHRGVPQAKGGGALVPQSWWDSGVIFQYLEEDNQSFVLKYLAQILSNCVISIRCMSKVMMQVMLKQDKNKEQSKCQSKSA